MLPKLSNGEIGMLVMNKDLMVPARKNGYAIGAFNVQNLESMSAVAEAATEEKSPVIMPDYAKRDQIRRLSLYIKLG